MSGNNSDMTTRQLAETLLHRLKEVSTLQLNGPPQSYGLDSLLAKRIDLYFSVRSARDARIAEVDIFHLFPDNIALRVSLTAQGPRGEAVYSFADRSRCAKRTSASEPSTTRATLNGFRHAARNYLGFSARTRWRQFPARSSPRARVQLLAGNGPVIRASVVKH